MLALDIDPVDGRTDVPGRADADTRPLRQERPGLVGLVEGAGDQDRVAVGHESVGEAA